MSLTETAAKKTDSYVLRTSLGLFCPIGYTEYIRLPLSLYKRLWDLMESVASPEERKVLLYEMAANPDHRIYKQQIENFTSTAIHEYYHFQQFSSTCLGLFVQDISRSQLMLAKELITEVVKVLVHRNQVNSEGKVEIRLPLADFLQTSRDPDLDPARSLLAMWQGIDDYWCALFGSRVVTSGAAKRGVRSWLEWERSWTARTLDSDASSISECPSGTKSSSNKPELQDMAQSAVKEIDRFLSDDTNLEMVFRNFDPDGPASPLFYSEPFGCKHLVESSAELFTFLEDDISGRAELLTSHPVYGGAFQVFCRFLKKIRNLALQDAIPNFFLVCDLALNAPLSARHIARGALWEDLHPGHRFLRLMERLGSSVEPLRELHRLSLGERNRQCSAFQIELSRSMGWFSPDELFDQILVAFDLFSHAPNAPYEYLQRQAFQARRSTPASMLPYVIRGRQTELIPIPYRIFSDYSCQCSLAGVDKKEAFAFHYIKEQLWIVLRQVITNDWLHDPLELMLGQGRTTEEAIDGHLKRLVGFLDLSGVELAVISGERNVNLL